jgi:transcriptional regulator with XRE-family HTH domain
MGSESVSGNLPNIFGEVLRELRRERGLSQEQLSFESGYNRTYIGLLERGLRTPSLKTIFKLASALNLRPSQLVQRVEEYPS